MAKNNDAPEITYQNEAYFLQILDYLQQILTALTPDGGSDET